MEFLKTMNDRQLNKSYKLYLMNAKKLSQRLCESYGLDNLTLQMFNSDTKLAQYTIDLAELKLKGFHISDDSYEIKHIKETTNKIATNTHIDPLTKVGVLFGYEMMPLALSVKGNVEDPRTEIELVDGFKRMFCIDEVPDMDVLVKVYEEFSDQEWINAMIVFNSWKFADGEGCKKYMDRGFQLGLFHRYGIRFVDMVMKWGDMFDAINLYTSGRDLNHYSIKSGVEGGAYYTLWNNPCFIDDLKSIYEILSYEPVFTIKKRGKPDQELKEGMKGFYSLGLYRVLEVFVSILGEVRRAEYQNGVEIRVPFDITILSNYMSDPNNQKHMIKVCQMTVDGFTMNYIRDHMRKSIRDYIYGYMGYNNSICG